MNSLKWLLGGLAVAAIAAAFRDFENNRWLSPAMPTGTLPPPDVEEPVLGYDGMDQETAMEWLADADLDEDTLLEIADYEANNLARQPVLALLEDLMR